MGMGLERAPIWWINGQVDMHDGDARFKAYAGIIIAWPSFSLPPLSAKTKD